MSSKVTYEWTKGFISGNTTISPAVNETLTLAQAIKSISLVPVWGRAGD